MAGYSATPLAKKLGIKEGCRVSLVNAPDKFQGELGALPAGADLVWNVRRPADLILFFAHSQTDLQANFSKLATSLASRGMLWVAWPKKASGVETNLNENVVRKIGLSAGLVDIKVCAINEIWSGLKFVFRLQDRAPSSRREVRG